MLAKLQYFNFVIADMLYFKIRPTSRFRYDFEHVKTRLEKLLNMLEW